MGYGEMGRGGSIQWMVIHGNPKRKDSKGKVVYGAPEKIQHYDIDKDAPDNAMITVIFKNARIVNQSGGGLIVEATVGDDADAIRMFWPPDSAPVSGV